jgi:hypothetical protein
MDIPPMQMQIGTDRVGTVVLRQVQITRRRRPQPEDDRILGFGGPPGRPNRSERNSGPSRRRSGEMQMRQMLGSETEQ